MKDVFCCFSKAELPVAGRVDAEEVLLTLEEIEGMLREMVPGVTDKDINEFKVRGVYHDPDLDVSGHREADPGVHSGCPLGVSTR